jgi:hypothetical protein
MMYAALFSSLRNVVHARFLWPSKVFKSQRRIMNDFALEIATLSLFCDEANPIVLMELDLTKLTITIEFSRP